MSDDIDMTREAVERFDFTGWDHVPVLHEDGSYVRHSDYVALSARLTECLERNALLEARLSEVEAERNAWMSDSAAAWDKCEERRLIQESAESAMERAYIAGLEEGARIVRLWDRASYRPEQPEPKYDSAHHNIATLASDPALVAAAVAKIMEGRG